jgi:protein-disulfide isomerase
VPEVKASPLPPVGDRDHLRGSEAPEVTLVEYGDFECPQCARAYPIVKRLQVSMGERLRFVFRHFPLTSSHPHAQRAAETAEWAGLAGKFWQMHDRLFEHQDRLDDKGLLASAVALALDPRDLRAAWDSHALIPRVKEDFLGGLNSGVTGTPKFFINGRRHDGLASVAELTAALDAAR